MSQYRSRRNAYVSGFVLSLALTLSAFWVVDSQRLSGWTLVVLLAALALTQLVVQLIFFLHLAQEPKPRWRLITLIFMAGVLIVLVFGSLWIMYNLSYNHRQSDPKQTEVDILRDEGFKSYR